MDHALENLGPEGFQQLCQVLLLHAYPDLKCFPVGQPDGGRDAVLLQSSEDKEKVEFGVFQVKFARNPKEGGNARDWVLESAKGEVQKVKELIERGATRYIFITNVQGTSHLDVGSIDKLQNELSILIGLPVTCWWRDDINRRLDGCWDIKLRYPQVLTGTDFLRLLLETQLGANQQRRLTAITAFLADQYEEDTDVKFKQVELQNKLLDLFVDLPFDVRIRSTLESLSDLFVDPSLPLTVSRIDSKNFELSSARDASVGTATLLLRTFHSSALGQIVVEGAPGQGKSTLAQYLCQVHRIRWLKKAGDLNALPRAHQTAPLCLPFKVDLRDFAAWIGGGSPSAQSNPASAVPSHPTLENFLAHLVETRSGGHAFSVDDLLEVAAVAPLLIVLDGLDEVAEIKRRGEVVSAVTKATNRLKETCSAVRIIVTSRPSAFANSPGFDVTRFPTLKLGSVQKEQIDTYAQKWMTSRNLDKREQAEFRKILDERLEEPHLRDLARNPMQLTILLSLIHTRGAALPDKRTTLYDYYVDLFFSREASKSLTVRKYADLLRNIHGYLAWTLHSNAETDKQESAGRISATALHSLLREYLEREQHGIEVLEEVFGATVERVFMIVARIEGTFEFEVQPLREYFAARYLYNTAPYSPPGRERPGTKPDRFDAIARNSYWLNVVRFFCGCFSKGELLDLAERVKELAKDARLKDTRYPITLTAMLMSDWVFSQVPKAVDDLARFVALPENFCKLLPDVFGHSDGSLVRIPDTCGGNIVSNSAFSLVCREDTKSDVLSLTIAFLSISCSRERLKSLWLDSAVLFTDRPAIRWAVLGRSFSLLDAAPVELIEQMLQPDACSDADWRDIVATQRYDVILSTPGREQRCLDAILDSINPPYINYSDAFYLVPQFLAFHNLWVYAKGKYIAEQLLEGVRRFREARGTSTMGDSGRRLAFSATMREVSELIANSIQPDTSAPLASINGLELAVETMRQAWGERVAIVLAAVGLSHVPKVGRNKACDLFDRQHTLSQRIRFARAQAKKVDYWKGQLRLVRSNSDLELFHMVFRAFAPTVVVLDLHEETWASLDGLTDAQTLRLLDLVGAAVMHNGSDRQVPFEKSIVSARQAWLVATGSGIVFAKDIFLRHLVSSQEPIQQVLQFRQRWALNCALTGDLPWETALDIIRETYAATADGSLIAVPPRRRKAFPDFVIERVLSAPGDYPAGLWAAVEVQASGISGQRARAVGTVAAQDGWFVD
ncbi:NACHT domain-containing NTPase [Paraburkholderia fungorum]|uniref:NACHT domain-containing protein n=1 Tax=Paraburkholderia fungorum TaxID=134537 RepID=A0A3R7HIY8_9BURK|nr:hypothetical protein [Paraburkholderia fungorum]RKF48316.1 hypothetical protein BCY88_21525 [Paraburkholderia fungorum]